MKNLNKKYIIVFLIIALLAVRFFIVYFTQPIETTVLPNAVHPTTLVDSPKKVAIAQNIITIKIADADIQLPIQKNASLYTILLAGKTAGQIHFTGKSYSGIGFFISSIGNLKEGDGKYLIYYVNGIEASVGISSYVPKAGDVIEWKLSTSL